MSVTQQQPAFNTKAAVITAVAHAVLLLLFFLISYKVPQMEPIDEMGVEVNLGTNADGYGTDQPMAMGEPAPDDEANTSIAGAANTDLPANVVESNDPEAPPINTAEVKKNNNATNIVNSNTRKKTNNAANSNTPQQKARYVYGGSKGTGGNNAAVNGKGGSEGNTTGNGDRGVPGGTPGASNYEGTPGSGGGISHNLTGRSIIAFPPPEAEFREGGKVVIRITVNKSGVITNKQVQSATNAQIREIALRKVNSVRFNKSETAPEEQFGNITFVFKTRS